MAKKVLSLAGVICSSSLVLAACGSSTAADQPSTGAVAPSAATSTQWCGEDGVIKVGFAKAATGFFAAFDQPGANGVKLALEAANAAGGIDGCQIESVEADAKGDPAVGGQVAQELLDQGAEILFVPNDFDLGVAAGQAAQAAGVLAISDGASSTQFGKAVGDLMFNGGLTSADTVMGQSEFAKEKGWTNYYAVSLDAFALFVEQLAGFKKDSGAKEVGVSIVAPDAADFAQPISKIRSDLSGPGSVVYANIYYPLSAAFIKQLREAGVTTPVLGNKDYTSPDIAAASGGEQNLKDVYYVSVAPGASPEHPEVQKFADDYTAAYGQAPESSMAINGYQIGSALVEALKTAKSVSGTELAAALNAQKNLKVPGGEIIAWRDGFTSRKVYVIDAGSGTNGGVVAEYAPTN